MVNEGELETKALEYAKANIDKFLTYKHTFTKVGDRYTWYSSEKVK